MSFCLRNALKTFQRFIDQIVCRLDLVDALCASYSEEEHIRKVDAALARFAKSGVLIDRNNWVFGASEMDFLGYHVSPERLRLLSSKVEAIQDFAKPSSLKRLRRYLGIVNFYHRFIQGCARVLQPLR